METCHELRRQVMAYIGEHFDPKTQMYEEVWDQAIDHVLGSSKPEDLTPDRRVVLTQAFTEISDVYKLALAGQKLSPYSPESAAVMAIRTCVPDVEPDDLPLEGSWQLAFNVVATWLINVRDGAWDATNAFLEVDSEGEIAP